MAICYNNSRFSSGAYDLSRHKFLGMVMVHISSCEAGFKSSQKVVGCIYDIHASILSVGVYCQLLLQLTGITAG